MADDAQRQHLTFALNLHRALGADGGACCSSPYSVASALGLTWQAARGATADELLALLAPGESDIAKQVELLSESARLEPSFGAEEPVLEVANTLWTAEDLPVTADYGTDLAAWPGAKQESAPFATDPEKARQAINVDVAQTTHELIQELVPEGAIGVDTVASLVNALYLKVAWRNPFIAKATEDADFHTPSGPRPVPTMRTVEQFQYAAADGWQAIGLPAAGQTEALVLLPDGDLAEAESTLDIERLEGLLGELRKRRVDLRLPRVDVGTHASMKDVLTQLGAPTMFTRASDLSGLSPDPRLSVSDVLHQTVLKLDEDGIEGAAATAVAVRMTAMPSGQPIRVDVDRPFLLLVRNTRTSAVYFLARVTDPSNQKGN